MKRLLLSSSNIKPVNIRIVSNGVQCADLKMLKENFCISDMKDVLDGRLVNWLNNIGENDLADRIKEKYSTSDSLNGHEYYFCELFFDNFILKDYVQILLKEKTDNLLTKEINRIPNLLVEAYKYCPTKFPILRWKTFFDIYKFDSEEFNQIKEKIADKQKQINDENKNQILKEDIEGRDNFKRFLLSCLYYYANNAKIKDWRSWANKYIKNIKLNGVYQEYALDFIDSIKDDNLGEWGFRDCIKKYLVDNNLTDIKI